MFKTGDRGRLRSDGLLIFMGRTDGDNMIKLHGVRIDLEDVANTLIQTADDVVAEAVITIHGEEEARMLFAHVVLCEGASSTTTSDTLQEMAQNLPLPAYMRPALVVVTESLPRTSNGKVDRKALAAKDLSAIQTQGYKRPSGKTSLEVGELSLLWTEVLHGHSFGNLSPESDFFMVIDTIIHAGSVGHYLNNYSSIRTPNLGSLRFLVQFALSRHIPIHFISSNRVALLSGSHVVSPSSISSQQPPTNDSEGFTASKWAGERLLETVAQQTDLCATIHRLCAIIGPNAPREDTLNALLRFSIAQKVSPSFTNLAGYLDFAPAESVSTAIAQLATRSQPKIPPSSKPRRPALGA